MDRNPLLLPSLLLGSAAMAQLAAPHAAPLAPRHADPIVADGTTATPTHQENGDRGGGDVVFYEDFANGLSGNNGVGGWTTSGPNGNIWKRKTTGPVGSFTVPAERIGAPATFANGFMVFQSDSANSNWANPANPVPVAAIVMLDGALTSPVLNLSATPAVKVEFQQRLRWCCQPTSPHALEVSTDGGATWPTAFPAAQGINTNNDPGTLTRSFILTDAIAANPANVRLRFKHNPVAGQYHWQIDDVRIIELFANDLKVDEGFLSHTNNGYEFGRIPQAQLYPTMLVGAMVTNRGAAAQTNVRVVTTVRNAANAVVFTSTATAASLAPNATASISRNETLPSLPEGLYTATSVVSSDQTEEVPADNTYLRSFQVTNARYALDGIGNHPAGYQRVVALGTSSFPDARDGLVFATYYKVRQNLTVYGIEARISSNSVAGGYVTVAVRDSALLRGTPPNVSSTLAESDVPLDITATHITAGVVRDAFSTPLTLPPGNYYATMTLNSNNGASHVSLLDDETVGQPPWASGVYIPSSGSGTFYSNGVALAIRLITEPFTGIGERERLTGVSIFPNPTSGMVNVRAEFAGAYTVEVMDVLGRTVANALGSGGTTVDLSGQAQGVYMVRVTHGDASMVQRIVLE